MQLQNRNPVKPVSALTGLGGIAFLAGSDTEHTTTAAAIKKILTRVAVSEPVALVIARHAGLIREAR